MAIRFNTQPISTFVFPGGECHVNLAAIPLNGHATVTALLADSDDILRLLLVVNALRQNDPSMTIDLILPYVPYARQNRVCNAGEAASIQVMAGLINGLRCRSVTIHDPHSDVAPALLERCIVVTQAELLLRNPLAGRIAAEGWTLPAPDAGAEKKARAVAKSLSSATYRTELLFASKTRDTMTGMITGTEIHGEVDGKRILILDDICDGGQTFVILAERLRALGAAEIYLYVTHGIFSKGLTVLREHFSAVFCEHVLRPIECGDDGFLSVFASY